MTLRHAGTCMLLWLLCVAKPCWSGLTSRHPDDEWQLSIFTAWYRSISFLRRVLLSISPALWRRFFQVTKPRWKTKQCTRVLTRIERENTHTHLSLFSTGHMEMSAPPKRCLLMSGHVAGMDPGHTYTLCPAVSGNAGQPSCTYLCHRPQEGN